MERTKEDKEIHHKWIFEGGNILQYFTCCTDHQIGNKVSSLILFLDLSIFYHINHHLNGDKPSGLCLFQQKFSLTELLTWEQLILTLLRLWQKLTITVLASGTASCIVITWILLQKGQRIMWLRLLPAIWSFSVEWGQSCYP